MTVKPRVTLAMLFSVVIMLSSACRPSTSTSTTSVASPTPSPLCVSAKRCIRDPAIAMPSSFPSDFPVYPGSRLTRASMNPGMPVPGKSTWGMVWKTFDSTDRVSAFYTASLSDDGWVIVLSGKPDGSYSAIFNSRSNTNSGGTLNVVDTGGVTSIGLALTVD
jgi:hypothetical protein